MLRLWVSLLWENCNAMKLQKYPQSTFRMSVALNRDLALVAKIRSRSKSECIREALKNYCRLYIHRPSNEGDSPYIEAR